MKMTESSLNRLKTLWEMEKLLITSNFSFSHSVFNGLFNVDTLKPGLVWERVYLLVIYLKFDLHNTEINDKNKM